MKRLLALVALLLLAVPLAPAQSGAGEFKVEVEKDISFGKGGKKDLQLDLARPVGVKGPVPCIVCVHGGGWRLGSRQDLSRPNKDFGNKSLIEAIAARGYVAVSVSYRLSQEDRFPAAVEDVKCAVRWLRANAKKLGIDPDRIGAVGFSAGGHLVCMLGACHKDDGLEGTGGNAEQSSRVQAVCSFFGPTDFTSKNWTEDVEKTFLEPFLGATFEMDKAIYKKASPIVYVTKGAPPFLFIHGTKDPLVGIDQSEKMEKKLKEVGAEATLLRMEGLGHGWGGDNAVKTFNAALKFFDEKLKQ